MSNFIITYKFFLNTSKLRACEVLLNRITKAYGGEIRVTKKEPYWKDPNQFVATFTIDLDETEIEKAIYKTIIITNCWCTSLGIGPPTLYDNGVFILEGNSTDNHFTMAGINCIIFELNGSNIN